MSQRPPIWTAQRLNQEMSRAAGTSIAFTPFGQAVRLDESMTVLPLDRAHIAGNVLAGPARAADLIPLDVAGLETVTANLIRLPAKLLLAALDPESWCVIVIHPNSYGSVGPFRDVSSSVREWLLRASQTGSSIANPRSADRIVIHTTRSRHQVPERPLPLTVDDEPHVAFVRLPDLVPGESPNGSKWLVPYLESMAGGRFGIDAKSETDALALAAGVWQMNDFLDRSHELSQSIEGEGRNRAGDYWHAIMHRREPDYSNAKYWLRRVGRHGIHSFLARDADDILASCPSEVAPRWRTALVKHRGQEYDWDAFAFVDLCQAVENGKGAELSLAARHIQLIEMALLLSSTLQDAVA